MFWLPESSGKKLINADGFRADNPFVADSSGNFRKVIAKFREHERSKLHINSIQRYAVLVNVPLNALLSETLAKQHGTPWHVLELLFRSARFLGSKGIPFRGDITCDGTDAGTHLLSP